MLADLVLGEGPLPGLQTATFSLGPHMVQRGSSGVSYSSYSGCSTLRTSSQPKYPPKALPSNTSHWGYSINIEIWGDTKIQSITDPKTELDYISVI